MTKPKKPIQDWLQKFFEPLTIVTLLLFAATLALYFATRDLVHDAQRNAERQLRAYVIFTDAIIKMNGFHPVASYTVKNVGQTPVYGLKQKLFIGIRKPILTNYDGIIWTSTQDVPYFSPTLLFRDLEGPQFNQNQIDALKHAGLRKMDDRLYFIGRATYRDVFNNERWTDFCFMFFGEDERSGCEFLNEADHENVKRRPD